MWRRSAKYGNVHITTVLEEVCECRLINATEKHSCDAKAEDILEELTLAKNFAVKELCFNIAISQY